jgi:hypothetical protein
VQWYSLGMYNAYTTTLTTTSTTSSTQSTDTVISPVVCISVDASDVVLHHLHLQYCIACSGVLLLLPSTRGMGDTTTRVIL